MGRLVVAGLLLVGLLPAQRNALPLGDLLTRPQHTAPRPTQRFVSRNWLTDDGEHEGTPQLRLGNAFRLLQAADAQVDFPAFGDEDRRLGLLDREGLYQALEALGIPSDSIPIEGPDHRPVLVADYPEQVTAALARLRAQVVRPATVHLRLERIVDGDVEVLLAGSRRSVDGRALVIADVVDRPAIVEADVEIAAGSSTANPVPIRITQGASAVLRVRALPFSDGHVAEVVVRHGRVDAIEPRQVHPSLGPLDRVTARFDEAGFTFRPGPANAPSQFEWPDDAGATLRLTVACDAPPADAIRGDVRIAATPLLGSPVRGFAGMPYDPEDPTLELDFRDFLARLENGDSEALRFFGTGERDGIGASLVLAGPDADRLARTIAGHFDAALRPAQIEVEVWDLPRGAAFPNDGPAPDGARRIGGLRGPMLADLPVAVASQLQSTWIRDWQSEVAQGSRSLDPVVDVFAVGPFLTVLPRTDADGRVTHADLHLALSRVVEFESRRFVAAGPAQGLSPEGGIPILLPEESALIDVPTIASTDVREVLELDADGRAELRQSASGVLGSGRELLIRLRLRATN